MDRTVCPECKGNDFLRQGPGLFRAVCYDCGHDWTVREISRPPSIPEISPATAWDPKECDPAEHINERLG